MLTTSNKINLSPYKSYVTFIYISLHITAIIMASANNVDTCKYQHI